MEVKLKHRKIVLFILTIVIALVVILMAAFGSLGEKTSALHDDYTALVDDPRRAKAVSVSGVDLVTQDISCGYAVIEMFSQWAGNPVTEEQLFEDNKGVATSTGPAFAEHMNALFPEYETTMLRYLPDSRLLQEIYDSLQNGIPVPVEMAAKLDGEWTLHYVLVTGLDLADDKVVLLNPYGYTEEISVAEFLSRTSFEAYENMPLGLQFGFAFDVFDKNAIFVAKPAT